MRNVAVLLDEAGARLEHITKITVYITDRAYRDPVYQAIGRHLKGVFPCSTGLIVKGLARPYMNMEIDVEAVIPPGEGRPPKGDV
jgi:enamine deaminase RidA (YjgF/YER057c/UK114 family)